MSEPIEREFPYRISLYMLWAAPPFFGLMSGLAIYFALTNSEPVFLQGVLEFPAIVANIAVGILGLLFAFLFVGFVVLAVQAITKPQRIALTASELLVPKGFWSRREHAIPYGEIVELAIQTPPPPASGRTLIVHHRHGKFAIEDVMLPSQADFEELWSTLEGRMQR